MSRWLRRIGIALPVPVAAVAVASLAYNAVTRNRDSFRYRGLALGRPLVVGHSLGAAVAVSLAPATAGIVLLDGDALPDGGGPGWFADLLVPPWYTSAYRIVTGSDWVFRRGLRSAGAPRLDAAEFDAWQRPFRVAGTAAAPRAVARAIDEFARRAQS